MQRVKINDKHHCCNLNFPAIYPFRTNMQAYIILKGEYNCAESDLAFLYESSLIACIQQRTILFVWKPWGDFKGRIVLAIHTCFSLKQFLMEPWWTNICSSQFQLQVLSNLSRQNIKTRNYYYYPPQTEAWVAKNGSTHTSNVTLSKTEQMEKKVKSSAFLFKSTFRIKDAYN